MPLVGIHICLEGVLVMVGVLFWVIVCCCCLMVVVVVVVVVLVVVFGEGCGRGRMCVGPWELGIGWVWGI